MKKAKPWVESLEEIEANLKTLEAYLDDPKYKNEALRLIRLGHNFVAYESNGEWRFAPSKFTGYVENSLEDHKKYGKSRSGGKTDDELDKIFNEEKKSNRQLDKKYRDYSQSDQIKPLPPRSKDQKQRKFWKVNLSENFEPRKESSKKSPATKKLNRGQGRSVTSEENKTAVEDHAMDVAKQHYKSEGYEVKDTHENEPYDLVCSKRGKIYVEVKGSTGTMDKITLTKNEVIHAKDPKNKCHLFLVSEIRLDRKNKSPKASGGKHSIVKPWKPLDKCLVATQYSYDLKCHRSDC